MELSVVPGRSRSPGVRGGCRPLACWDSGEMAELCRLPFENPGTDFRGEVTERHAPVPTGNGRLNPAQPTKQAERHGTGNEQKQEGSRSGRDQSEAEGISDGRGQQPQADAWRLRVSVFTPAGTQQVEAHRGANEVIQSYCQ